MQVKHVRLTFYYITCVPHAKLPYNNYVASIVNSCFSINIPHKKRYIQRLSYLEACIIVTL